MKSVVFSRKFEKAYKQRVVRDPKLKAAYAERYSLFCAGERGYRWKIMDSLVS